jgi:hypothetical protein
MSSIQTVPKSLANLRSHRIKSRISIALTTATSKTFVHEGSIKVSHNRDARTREGKMADSRINAQIVTNNMRRVNFACVQRLLHGTNVSQSMHLHLSPSIFNGNQKNLFGVSRLMHGTTTTVLTSQDRTKCQPKKENLYSVERK